VQQIFLRSITIRQVITNTVHFLYERGIVCFVHTIFEKNNGNLARIYGCIIAKLLYRITGDGNLLIHRICLFASL
jgi:hypothetical protein